MCIASTHEGAGNDDGTGMEVYLLVHVVKHKNMRYCVIAVPYFILNNIVMRIILLAVLMMSILFFHNVKGQSISFEMEDGVISHLIGEDQHGDQVKFQPPEEKPLVLFFLPKANSRSEAEWMMDNVTTFFECLKEFRSQSINGILVIEPTRSGPLVNRIFRSKLSDKPFPVIRDHDGDIIGEVHDKAYSIMAWLINKDGEILYRSLEPFSESGYQKMRDRVSEITNVKAKN